MTEFLAALLWWIGLIWATTIIAAGLLVTFVVIRDWLSRRHNVRRLREIMARERTRTELEESYNLPTAPGGDWMKGTMT